MPNYFMLTRDLRDNEYYIFVDSIQKYFTLLGFDSQKYDKWGPYYPRLKYNIIILLYHKTIRSAGCL